MSIWDKYPNFSKEEMQTLVALTAQAFLDAEGDASTLPEDILRISPRAASRELLPLLQEPGAAITKEQIQQVLEDEDLSTQVCLKILDEVRRNPEMAERVAAAYEASSRKMVIPELLLLSGAIVILAIKIKEIRWGGKEKKISFYESSEAVKTFVSGLVRGVTG